MTARCRIGVDVGGTFTDLVLWDEATGEEFTHKVSSTPDDPSRAIADGVLELCEAAGRAPADVALIVHGTTVATNTVIEGTGARMGMITTSGFRDIMHIARKKRPFNFSHSQDVPWQRSPLVRRRDRMVVDERVTAPDGEVVRPLDEAAVRAAAEQLRDAGVHGVAVCFLFSFLNPEHEQRAVRIVREVMPDAFVSASHEVVPLHREYERFSTTAVNVYVGPRTSAYVNALQDRLSTRHVTAGVRLMTSSGGVVTSSSAAEHPVSLLLSGPAAGLLAGIRTGRSAGNPSVITLDVGGTSADIGVAPAGEVRMKHLLDTRVGAYQVMVPMVDVETVGAGGGSIARVSEHQVLEVGPASAGAVPGPVCYGRGGTAPTVTDAAAVLGWLRAETFFGGRIPLAVQAATEAVRAVVADPLDLSVEEAALGIHTVLTHTMASSILELSVRRGHDPRDFDLVAQGGAGPLFACTVGTEIGVARVLVPPHPGLASAHGLLDTDLQYESVASVWTSDAEVDVSALAATVKTLTADTAERLTADGLTPDAMSFAVYADCRYAGQGYELRVPAPGTDVDAAWVERTVESFHRLHEATYRSRFDTKVVQLVNVRVVGIGAVSHLEVPVHGTPTVAVTVEPTAVIQSWFRVADRPVRMATPVYDRGDLVPGAEFAGPAIVEQPDSTIVVDPDYRAVTDGAGNLVLTRQEPTHA